MPKRFCLLLAAIVAAVADGAAGTSPSVSLQLFPLTGEVRIANDDPSDFTFVAYTLDSPSGALNGTSGVWKSIADTYDASGNGFIDATHQWSELTPDAGAHATSLSEGSIPYPGGVFPANRSLSLGTIWNPSVVSPPDVKLTIYFSEVDNAIYDGVQEVDGDYFRDGDVDVFDYNFWKAFYGSTSANFADGNLDGIVDAADYTIWRNNLGLSVPGSGSGESGLASAGLSGAVVPEPGGIILGLLACVGCLAHRRPFRRRV